MMPWSSQRQVGRLHRQSEPIAAGGVVVLMTVSLSLKRSRQLGGVDPARVVSVDAYGNQQPQTVGQSAGADDTSSDTARLIPT